MNISYPTFRTNIVPSLRTFRPCDMKVLWFFETSGNDYPMSLRHIPGEGSPQPHRCENLKIQNLVFILEFGEIKRISVIIHLENVFLEY
jgi:hypothetical protein